MSASSCRNKFPSASVPSWSRQHGTTVPSDSTAIWSRSARQRPVLPRSSARRATLTTNGTLLPKKQGALLRAPALRKVSVSLHSFEANEAGDFSAYLTGCTDFARAAKEAGVLTDFRLWNLDGAQTKGLHDRNAEILARLHAAFPGD